MIIFNTTYHLEHIVSEEALRFFKEEYIPKAVASGLFTDPSLSKVHASHGESGVTYALHFRVKDIETLEKWVSETGEGLKEELLKKFGNQVAGFSTLLEEIEL